MVRRSTWIVLGIFALLVGFAFFFQRYQGNKTESAATATPTAAPVYLFNLGDASVSGMKIEDNAGNSIDMFQDPILSNWVIAGSPAEQADTATISSLSSQVKAMKVEETLIQSVPLASIGLDPAAYTITITSSDGSKLVVDIGMKTVIGSGYYVKGFGGQVMIVSASAMESLLDLLKNPPILPTPTPEVAPTGTVSPTGPGNQPTPTP